MTFAWIAVVVVIIAAAAYAIGRGSRRNRDLVGDQMAATVPSPGVVTQARWLVAEGRKIEAIKLYREATGMGLAEAKTAVEGLASGTPAEPLAPETATELGDLAARAREMKQRGDTIRAIKLVRTATGLDLRAAKEFVDEL